MLEAAITSERETSDQWLKRSHRMLHLGNALSPDLGVMANSDV